MATSLSTRTAVEGGTPKPRPTPFEARFDSVASRLFHLSKTAPTERMRQEMADLSREMNALRRDLAGGPLVTGRPVPVINPNERRRIDGGRDGRRNIPGRTTNYAKKNRPGERHCPAHNQGKGAWLPVDDFDIKVRETGQLKSWCRGCLRVYQQERYVRAGSKAVTIEVIVGDTCVGALCPICHEPFVAGQRIQGQHTAHEKCIDDAPPGAIETLSELFDKVDWTDPAFGTVSHPA